MKYENGLKCLRFNEKTGKWYKDNPKIKNPWSMTVYLISETPCIVCNEKFFYCSGNKGNCCSLSCNTKYRNSIYGISKETAKKISISNTGKPKKVPPETQKRLSEFRRQKFLGDKNPAWKGGITSKNGKIYNSPEYKDWRKYIFERDDYTCALCKSRGKKIEAHHIKEFSTYEKLRFDVNNGITLCLKCHREIRGKEKSYYDLFTSMINNDIL